LLIRSLKLVLNQVRKTLKEHGRFVVSMDVWPQLLARLHYMVARLFPALPKFNRLYSYTYRGFQSTLLRHFDIVEEVVIRPRLPWLLFRKEILFICRPRNQ